MTARISSHFRACSIKIHATAKSKGSSVAALVTTGSRSTFPLSIELRGDMDPEIIVFQIILNLLRLLCLANSEQGTTLKGMVGACGKPQTSMFCEFHL